MTYTDAERLDFLEQAARKSQTGISFDYINKHQQSPYGFRFMRRFFVGDARRDIRSAIDSCIDELSTIQKGEKQKPDPEPQNIPRFEPIKREDFVKALCKAEVIEREPSGKLVNGQSHARDLTTFVNSALGWLNDLQIDEPQGCVIFKVPLPEIEKLRAALDPKIFPENTNVITHRWGSVVALFEETYPADDGRTIAQCGNGDTGVQRASAIAAALNFIRKLI